MLQLKQQSPDAGWKLLPPLGLPAKPWQGSTLLAAAFLEFSSRPLVVAGPPASLQRLGLQGRECLGPKVLSLKQPVGEGQHSDLQILSL